MMEHAHFSSLVMMIRVAGSREVFGASVRPSESKFGVEN